jgi:hypothetical protein
MDRHEWDEAMNPLGKETKNEEKPSNSALSDGLVAIVKEWRELFDH